jgi:hypothetical protein
MAAQPLTPTYGAAGGLGDCNFVDRQPKETAMNTHPTQHNRRRREELHPIVYRLIVGLAVWLVLSIWLLFNRGSYVALNLAMITVFFVIAVGIPLILGLTWLRNSAIYERNQDVMSFREWTACAFITRTGELSGREAAIQILLPIAAVSIGMTIFGLVFYIDVPNIG